VTPTDIQYYWNAPKLSLAGGIGDNRLAFSIDGINWTASTSGNSVLTNTCYIIANANGLWVAGGDGTNKLGYSTDGINWTAATSANSLISGVCAGLAYANGLWLAGGVGTLAYSGDGINWTADLSGNGIFTSQWFSIAYGNGIWVAGGDGTNQLAYSTDGINWTPSVSGNSVLTEVCYKVAYENGIWFAGGSGGVAYSRDGINWTPSLASGLLSVGVAFKYGNGLWVAGGNNGGNTLIYSRDGINWSGSVNGADIFTSYCSGIEYANGLWTATGNGTNQMAYSRDAMNWTANTSGNALITVTGESVVAASIPAIYRLHSENPSLNYTTTGTNIDITGLTTLTDYSFTIKTDISGNYSTTVPFRTVKTSAKPAPVATLTFQTNGNLTFSWTDPADYAYYYVYSLRAATGTKESIYEGTSDYGTLSHSFPGIDVGRSYTFTIRRGNDAGYSLPISITTKPVFFDPRTVAGLHFWVDAADAYANGSSVPDGTTVTLWCDKSGTNNATGGAVIRTDDRGRYLDMSGSSYALTTSSWIYNQYFNIFVVDKPTAYGTLVGTNSNALNIAYDASGIILSTYGDHAALGNDFETVAAPVNIWCFSNYGGKTAYWNKLVSGKGSQSSFVTDSSLKIGNYSGRMREVLIYTGVMAENDREAVQNYLYTKWFTQPNLIPLVPVENGCVLWIDAADPTSFFQDASGTVPGGDGLIAARWKDKSGYENDIVDLSGGYRYYKDGINGGATLYRIQGYDNWNIQTANFIESGDATLFIVAESSSAGNIFNHDISGNFGLVNNGTTISWRESATANNNQFTNYGSPFLFYGTMKKGQLLKGTFVDPSGVQTSYAIDTLSMPVAAAPIRLGGTGSADYAEIIYYNRALTDAEVQQNAAYLSNKWSAPISVPSFLPLALSPQVWLDSADPYTVFEDASGLLIWKDKSGHGYDALPQGSLPLSDGVVFRGSQYLSLPDRALPTGNYSYYAVAKFTGDSQIIHGGSKDISGQIWVQAGGFPGDIAIEVSYDLVTFIPVQSPLRVGLGVGYNGSYWVAVGYSSDHSVNIIKSSDGITWIASSNNPFYTSSNGAGKLVFGITWGGGTWVALGYDGGEKGIAVSTDGLNWLDSVSAGGNNPFYGNQGSGVAYNGSYFVAVGTNSGYNGEPFICIATSPDGINWTASTNNPFDGGIGQGIAWNGSYWVAVGNNGPQTVCIAKSYDGLNWTPSTNNPFAGGVGTGILWSGSFWGTFGTGGSGVVFATSTDGMNWTTGANPFSGTFQPSQVGPAPAPVHNSIMDIKTVSTPNLYVAGGYGINTLVYSTDGINWTASESGNALLTAVCAAVAYGNGIWVAGGNGTTQLAYSIDGINWTALTSGNSVLPTYYFTVAYGNIWVAGGGGTNQLAYSIDGINWTGASSYSVFTSACNAVAYGNLWVAGGEGTNQMAYSTDGINWTGSTSGNSVLQEACRAVAYGDKWVAGGNGINQLAYSTDGITWYPSTSGNSILTGACWAVAYANSTWVAGGAGANTLAYSTDGINWTASTTQVFTSTCTAVGYANGLWIAGGLGLNQLAYSTDGMNWIVSTSGNSVLQDACRAVAGVGAAMYAQTSFDSILTDKNVIPVTQTVIVESIYNGGKRLFLNGASGPTDSSSHFQDASNNFIGWDMSGNYMNGTIKEILIYGEAHTATQRKQVEQYLKAKWYPQTYAPSATALWLDSTNLTPGRLQTWPDRSGHTDLSQNVIWAQPLCSTDAVTGRQGVQFAADGIANGFSARPFGTTDSWSVFSVQRYDYSSNQYTDLLPNVCTAYETVGSSGPGWVAGGADEYSTVCIAFSSDGINWKPSTNNPFSGGVCTTVAWNGSYWLAGGYNIATSTDGLIWTPSTNNLFSGGLCNTVAWNGSYWMAVGNNGDSTVCIIKSLNGINWRDSISGGGNNPFSGGYCTGIAWSGNYWVAVGNNGEGTVNTAKSLDGVTWVVSLNTSFNIVNGIAWNGTYWVSVGYVGGHTISITTSTDGMEWTNASNNPFAGGQGTGITWNGYWVASGFNTDRTVCIATSTDGMTWTDASNNPFLGGQGVVTAWNGYWLAGGYNSSGTISIAKSTDGMTWTPSINNPFPAGGVSAIASGTIAFTPTTSLGTYTTSTPSVNEINFYTGDTTSVEIHKTPVLVEEIVNASILSEVVNTSLLNRYTTSSLTNNLLRIGFRGSLPSLKGAMRGYIYELIAYNRVVGKDEQQAVEGYLSWKWGVPLPTTHPYYIAPPVPQTPFTPTQIAGCQLWLDGADAATIDLSGTTVIAWADKSGLANNFTIKSPFTGPTVNNGLNFSSGAVLISANSFTFDGNTNVFIVANIGSPSGFEYLLAFDGQDLSVRIYNNNLLGITNGGNNDDLAPLYTVNGTPGRQTDFTEATLIDFNGSSGSGNLTISDGLEDGGGSGRFFTGNFKECIIYSGPLTTKQIQTLQGYLATKWGLQSSLPVSHPYYLPPPINLANDVPLQIAGCQLWLDSADAATITIGKEGILVVWDDKSPFSNVSGIYGNFTYSNGVVFDGSTTYLTTNYTANPVAETVFIVMNVNATASAFILGDSTTVGGRNLIFADGHVELDSRGIGGVAGVDQIAIGTTILYEYVSNTTTNMYYNGRLDITGTPAPYSGGGLTWIGYGRDITPFLDGTIKEIIIYNKALVDSQRIKVEGYLATKWGIQSSLPSWHPYYIPFSPIQIAGMQLWLDGADAATIDLSGSAVVAWTDKSGTANDATGIGGLTYANNTVVFDGTGYLTVPYTANPTAETVFIVMKFNSIATATIIDSNSGGGERQLALYQDKIQLNAGGQGGPNGNNTIPINTTILYSYTLDTTVNMYYNGVFDASGSTPTFANGGNTWIGGNSYHDNPLNGTISEVLIYDSVLSDTDRQAVEAYLINKWNIPFSPTQIAGMQLWLDGADAATITLSGSTVTAWADKSGLGNNTTGLIGTGTSYNNGVVFDGTSHFTLPDGCAPYNDASYSIYIVATWTAPGIIELQGGILGFGGAPYTVSIRSDGSGPCIIDTYWNANNLITSATFNLGTTVLYDSLYVSGGNRNAYLFGSPSGSDTPGMREQPASGNVLGQTVYGEKMIGTIQEILVYNIPHSTADRQRVEGYLANKWGIQAKLPEGHPYKNAAP